MKKISHCSHCLKSLFVEMTDIQDLRRKTAAVRIAALITFYVHCSNIHSSIELQLNLLFWVSTSNALQSYKAQDLRTQSQKKATRSNARLQSCSLQNNRDISHSTAMIRCTGLVGVCEVQDGASILQWDKVYL